MIDLTTLTDEELEILRIDINEEQHKRIIEALKKAKEAKAKDTHNAIQT